MSEHDDVADTLQTERTHYAIQEDALVDQTFLQRLQRQRAMHSKQLRATVFVRTTSSVSVAITLLKNCMPTLVSS